MAKFRVMVNLGGFGSNYTTNSRGRDVPRAPGDLLGLGPLFYGLGVRNRFSEPYYQDYEMEQFKRDMQKMQAFASAVGVVGQVIEAGGTYEDLPGDVKKLISPSQFNHQLVKINKDLKEHTSYNLLRLAAESPLSVAALVANPANIKALGGSDDTAKLFETLKEQFSPLAKMYQDIYSSAGAGKLPVPVAMGMAIKNFGNINILKTLAEVNAAKKVFGNSNLPPEVAKSVQEMEAQRKIAEQKLKQVQLMTKNLTLQGKEREANIGLINAKTAETQSRTLINQTKNKLLGQGGILGGQVNTTPTATSVGMTPGTFAAVTSDALRNINTVLNSEDPNKAYNEFIDRSLAKNVKGWSSLSQPERQRLRNVISQQVWPDVVSNYLNRNSDIQEYYSIWGGSDQDRNKLDKWLFNTVAKDPVSVAKAAKVIRSALQGGWSPDEITARYEGKPIPADASTGGQGWWNSFWSGLAGRPSPEAMRVMKDRVRGRQGQYSPSQAFDILSPQKGSSMAIPSQTPQQPLQGAGLQGILQQIAPMAIASRMFGQAQQNPLQQTQQNPLIAQMLNRALMYG